MHQQEAWNIEITMPYEAPDEAKGRQAKVIRRGLPIVCVKSSTLHVLQGSTADSGLVFHLVFPRLLKRPTRWLATYVALSRVRRLKNLRPIGLDKDIQKIMEEEPPGLLPAQFHKLLIEKQAQIALDADAAMAALGWA